MLSGVGTMGGCPVNEGLITMRQHGGGVLVVNEGTTGKLSGESLGTMVVCQA